MDRKNVISKIHSYFQGCYPQPPPPPKKKKKEREKDSITVIVLVMFHFQAFLSIGMHARSGLVTDKCQLSQSSASDNQEVTFHLLNVVCSQFCYSGNCTLENYYKTNGASVKLWVKKILDLYFLFPSLRHTASHQKIWMR